MVNDDGYDALGLKTLANRLIKDGHKVTVCAPERGMSGAGHAMTFRVKLSCIKREGYEYPCYSVNGYPCDCVLIGTTFMDKKPDMLISGINSGANLGTEVLYSGTVNAAIEGAVRGIPSVGLSQWRMGEDAVNAQYAADYFVDRLELYYNICKGGTPISVNCHNPSRPDVGDKIASVQGLRLYDENYEIHNEGEVTTFFLDGEPKKVKQNPLSDVALFKEGYSTILPLRYSYNNPETAKRLRAKFGL